MTSIQEIHEPPYIADMTKLTSYAEIDEVLRSKDFAQGSHQESQAFFGHSILLLDGDDHFERRRMESGLFTKQALAYYERHALVPVIDQAMKECDDQRGEDGIVRADLVPLARTMLLRIAASVTGIDGVDTPEATERFRWIVEELGGAVTVEWSTEDHAKVIEEGLETRAAFEREFWDESVARRRALIAEHRAGRLDASELPRDLITMLYLNWDESWDDELPLREGTLYLVAATQTTTHAIPHIVRHLLEWFEEHPEDEGKRFDKDFLQRAAQESMRLHLPAPSLLRYATKDVTLSSGRTIVEGERVACLFTPANRDTERFGEDAETYNPYREVTGRTKPWGLTFGGGEHLCIGRPLVTGLSSRTDPEEGTRGTVLNILLTLLESGVQLDPDAPPQYMATTHHDAYGTFPTLLVNR